jgi:hypothetical protein
MHRNTEPGNVIIFPWNDYHVRQPGNPLLADLSKAEIQDYLRYLKFYHATKSEF